MFVSKSLDYAMRALIYLGDNNTRSGMKEIAAAMDIPSHYLSKILRALVRGELVLSDMGPGGGYALTRSPEAISVADVYTAVEGQFHVVACSSGAPNDCEYVECCSQFPIWDQLEKNIYQLLDGTTLADFLNISSPVKFVSSESLHSKRA